MLGLACIIFMVSVLTLLLGGHALGSAEETLYHSDGFVEQATRDGQPVIFVGINYRLGIFGFATGEALINSKHTNAGLRDQRAAFECKCYINFLLLQ